MDTIVALSSGALPSGVAVIRISGPAAFECARSVIRGATVLDRQMRFVRIVDPLRGEPIDSGLACAFRSPKSFTGEDSVELHLHGSRAAVHRVLALLGDHKGVRLAEPGEFTRQAFLNGKLDLTSAEGLADLIDAQTEAQRKLAYSISSGHLSSTYKAWREKLLRWRALLEADIDFADEDDVPGSVGDDVFAQIPPFISELEQYVSRIARAELVREGFRVAIVGPPNAGKSTLLNILAGRDAAIVTDVPGTTRDVVEVQMDVEGFLVRVSDTAGIRETKDRIEREGIRRAYAVTQEADLVLSLAAEEDWISLSDENTQVLRVATKSDLGMNKRPITADMHISAKTNAGIDLLVKAIASAVESSLASVAERGAGNLRHAARVNATVGALGQINQTQPLEFVAEALRVAADELGQLTGEIGTEDLLGEIFSSFCIGK